MRMRHFKLAAAGLCLLAVHAAAAEDLTIVSEVVVAPRPYVSATLTLWMTAGKVRLSDGHRDWIYDVATGTRIDLDHLTRTYWQGTEAERAARIQALDEETKAKLAREQAEQFAMLRAARKFAPTGGDGEWWRKKPTREEREALIRELQKQQAALEAMAKAEEEFDRLPQAMRDSVGKRLPPKRTAFASTVERGTDDKAIAGYDCEHYRISVTRVFEDGSKKNEIEQELWLAPKLKPPVSFEVLKLVPFLPGMHLTKGLPLASIAPSPSGSLNLFVVAAQVKKGPIDASVFAVPAGYTRVDSPISPVGSYVEMR
jgi:hypothetical protein